jgi:hypothetical protein
MEYVGSVGFTVTVKVDEENSSDGMDACKAKVEKLMNEFVALSLAQDIRVVGVESFRIVCY